MGLRFLYASDTDSMITMEFNVLIRFYLFNRDEHKGLFLQANGGASLVSSKKEDAIEDKEVGTVSAGIFAGWRFPFGKYFFVEPAIRVGYPYIYGAGVSSGCRM